MEATKFVKVIVLLACVQAVTCLTRNHTYLQKRYDGSSQSKRSEVKFPVYTRPDGGDSTQVSDSNKRVLNTYDTPISLDSNGGPSNVYGAPSQSPSSVYDSAFNAPPSSIYDASSLTVNNAFPSSPSSSLSTAPSTAFGMVPSNSYSTAPDSQYGTPPTSQYGAPPAAEYGPPPALQYGPPPKTEYGPPPALQYGPPPAPQYGPPPAPQYGPPPTPQYGPPPAPQYGPPPAPQYGPPPAPQYGPPPAPQYGPPPTSSYGVVTEPPYGAMTPIYGHKPAKRVHKFKLGPILVMFGFFLLGLIFIFLRVGFFKQIGQAGNFSRSLIDSWVDAILSNSSADLDTLTKRALKAISSFNGNVSTKQRKRR